MNHKNEWTRWSIENKNSIFSKFFLLPISLVLLVDSRVTVARRVITDQLTLQFELGDDGLIIVDESRATWKVVGWLVTKQHQHTWTETETTTTIKVGNCWNENECLAGWLFGWNDAASASTKDPIE